MKRLATWIIAGAICLAAVAIAQAQQTGGEGKKSSQALPAEECKAIEQYIAKIDAARSIREKAQREAKYAEAQTELKAAFKSRDDAALLAQATEYANTTEQVATMDPMDSKLAEVLDKKLKLRGALLERCEDYTATR